MNRIFLTYLLFLSISIYSFGQGNKIFNIEHTNEKIKIDGFLDESIWENTIGDSNFVQFEPYNKQEPSEKTIVKIIYDNNALYISAECKISRKENIFKILSKRDDFGQADYFGFYIDPYNTGITGYGFFVTSAGVQIDLKIDGTDENLNWDAVWYSSVNITDTAYFIEMKIPFSAFRFPKKQNQNWNINFYRNIQKNREIVTWNYVDNSKNGILNQMGAIKGVKEINPPLRISLMPYISAYGQRYAGIKQIGKTYSGGLDLKYGINESFTLDVMLIPDYNQIQSDDQELNLSPYETFYDDKRYFFTEGTEIFDKGNIFYSRRIGKTPTLYSDVPSKLNENEIILTNPQQTQIYNATKFSGKTNNGFGIGFLNAFTGTTYAEIIDTLIDRNRTIITEPFSNYNVIALNQPLKNNSYISLTNTNFSSFGRNYYSNVTAQEAYLKNAKNSWAIFQRFSLSNIFNDTLDANRGFAYRVSAYKTSGNFRVSATQQVYSNKYNPNDLGYLRQNNLVTNSISLSYNTYKPSKNFLLWRNSINISQKSLYDSLSYIGTTITFSSSTKLKNNLSIGLSLSFSPFEEYDFFEPRVEKRFFSKEPYKNLIFWLSSNYSNSFAFDIRSTYSNSRISDQKQNGFSFLFAPRIRLSNNALFVFSNNIEYKFNDVGYVGKTASEDSVFFGKRDIRYVTNNIEFDYVFSKDISLNLKLRHYWSVIDYFEYYTLGNNGKLYPLRYSYHFVSNNDLNYNILTADLVFKWIFMPGSELSVVYKKQIISNTNNLIYDYYDNFENMYFFSPRLNSISFKVIFYLDYNLLVNKKSL